MITLGVCGYREGDVRASKEVCLYPYPLYLNLTKHQYPQEEHGASYCMYLSIYLSINHMSSYVLYLFSLKKKKQVQD